MFHTPMMSRAEYTRYCLRYVFTRRALRAMPVMSHVILSTAAPPPATPSLLPLRAARTIFMMFFIRLSYIDDV